MYSLDFDEYTGSEPGNLYGASTRKIVEEGTMDNGIVEHVQAAAEGVDYLYLWLDCDREGENICYEIITACKEVGLFHDETMIYRAKFSALTESEIKYAFLHPIRPNPNESASVDARQEMDLKVGCSFTRFLTRQLLAGSKDKFKKPELKVLSYGPCQTPTLWFCVERHREILSFIPEQFWEIKISVLISGAGIVNLDHSKGRMFDASKANKAFKALSGVKAGTVTNIRRHDKVLDPPPGLDTVTLLRMASGALGVGPKACMEIAERLYTSGYISYPRTESSRYPSSFDMNSVLKEHQNHPYWGQEAWNILAEAPGGVVKPPGRGIDAGDHPPITPTRAATRGQLRGDRDWKIYEMIARHFIASLLPPMKYIEHIAEIKVAGELFRYTWHHVTEEGFTRVAPWKRRDLKLNEPEGRVRLEVGNEVVIKSIKLEDDWTKPPSYLKEADLIGMMDANGIGTDASIPTHVNTVQERQYVDVCDAEGNVIDDDEESSGNKGRDNGGGGNGGKKSETYSQRKGKGGKGGDRWNDGKGKGGSKGGLKGGSSSHDRFMVPTPFGVALIDGMESIVPAVVRPQIRAKMEKQVSLIAEGKEKKESVVVSNLAVFYDKYLQFSTRIGEIRSLFVNEGFQEPTHGGDGLDYGSMRRREEADDVASTICGEMEKKRQYGDRLAVKEAMKKKGTLADTIALDLFSFGEEKEVASTKKNTMNATSTISRMGLGGVPSYMLELENLRAIASSVEPIVNYDKSEPIKDRKGGTKGSAKGGNKGSKVTTGGRGKTGGQDGSDALPIPSSTRRIHHGSEKPLEKRTEKTRVERIQIPEKREKSHRGEIPAPALTPPIEVHVDADWYYLDEHGKTQGPFDGQKMQVWRTAGFLLPDLKVRQGQHGEFVLLKTIKDFNLGRRDTGKEKVRDGKGRKGSGGSHGHGTTSKFRAAKEEAALKLRGK